MGIFDRFSKKYRAYFLIHVTYINWTEKEILSHAAPNDSTPYERLERQCSVVLALEGTEGRLLNIRRLEPYLIDLAKKKLGKIVISLDSWQIIKQEELPSINN